MGGKEAPEEKGHPMRSSPPSFCLTDRHQVSSSICFLPRTAPTSTGFDEQPALMSSLAKETFCDCPSLESE